MTFAAANAGVYALTATLAGCPATAYTTVVASSSNGEWTGNTSSDWATTSNWCTGTLPTSATDVTIPAGATNMPVVGSSVSCKNLTTQSGATVTTSVSGTLNIAGTLTNNGTMVNNGTTNFNGTSGQQTFSGVTAFHNISVNNANGLLLPSAITVANDLTIGAGILTTNNHSITVAGSWYNNASTAGFAAGTSTVTFNGSAAQTLGGSFATTFNHLTVTNTGNTVTSAANCTVGGNLMVTSGTLNLGAFTANRGSVGGILTVNNNATLKIGGTNTFPTNYTTNTLLLASNVEYAGTNQTIANHAYGNLILSSESGAAVKTFPGTALSVMGNLTLNQGAGTSVTATAAANIAVNGNVSIGSATTLNGGGQALAIGGNWVTNGTFTGNGSTVSMNGTGKAISGSGTHNFHNLTVTAPSVTMAAATNIQVAGNLATTGIGALTHGAGGTLTMSGSNKTISGLDIMLDNLTVSGTASAAMSLKVAGNLAVSGSFTTSAGVLELSGASKTITGAGSISLHTLKTSGSISSTANFSITNSLNVTGSLSASAGTVTFTGTSSLTGIANLYNVDLNCTTATLDVDAEMGIANALTVTAGTLDVATHEPNTVNFNGSGAQSVNAITYNKLVLSGGNTKTAAGPVVAMDLLIAAATTFSGATHTHELRRNWTNNGTFTAGTSTVEFTGTEESILTGPTTFHILTLDKASSAGTAKLASNVSVPTLNMVTGTLFTYANTITITTTRTGNGEILGNIQRQHSFTTGVDYAFESPYNTVNFSAVTGVTSITVSVATGAISDFPFGGSINRVYDIDVPAGSYTATLRLHYRDAELNGNVESTMALWHYNGATWGASGSTGNSTTNNYVDQASLSDITDRWTLSDNANVIRWNGSVSSDWNTAANWTAVQGSPSAPPGLSDIAKLGTAAFTNQPTISTAVTVKNILFGSVQAVTLSLGSGGSLNTGDINGQWTSNVAHTLAVGAQTLTVNGDLNLSDGTNGHTIDLTIGAGTVTVNQLLVESGDADITFSGAGTLNVGGHFHYMGGTFTAGSGTVVYNGSTMQHVGIVTYNNLTIDNSAAAVEIGDTLVVNGDLLVSTGNLGNNALLTIGDDVTIASGATFENWEKILVAGDWTNNGTFSDFGGTTIFNGTGAQSISASAFGNLIIDKASGTATITGDLTTTGDFSILAGTFDFQGYFINRSILGGFAIIANGATALISGTNGPVNFSTYALGLTSTVVFNGTGVQYVNFGGLDFGNVILRNGGANQKVLVAEATVLGNLTIESGATLNADSWPITLDGNWVNNGSFVPGTSTLHLTGTGKTLSGVTTLNKGTVAGSYFANQDLTFNDILEITPGGSISAGTGHTLILHGDLLNAGTMSTDGTVILSGTQAQTLSLVNATNYALYVEFNGSVPPTLNSTSAPVFGYLAVNNTGGVSPSVGWTVGYGMTVGSGATFNGGAFTHSILGNFTNSGTVTSSGILNFAPGAAATVNLGSNFASTGLVKFAGAGAMTLSGSPTALYDVTVANTHASGISPATDWTLSHDLTIQSGATLHGGARTFTIGRNFTNSGTFDAGSSTLVFNGTALQTFTSSSAVHNMTVSKASDLLALASDASVGGTLNFTAGKIQTSTNSVNILASGSLTGAAQNTGWV
ncbi:MAG TPA: hypothetical protein VHS96_01880, partial [Bacteroidia bacterium]|nr:hypothetical protein [Bacteroidia bacterium]